MRYLSSKKQLVISILIILFAINISSIAQNENSPFKESLNYKLKIGERLYYGLISNDSKSPSCISCHARFTGDEINWNPTAQEVVNAADSLTEENFKKLLLEPGDGFISKVHAGFSYSDEQISYLHLYLKDLKKTGIEQKPKSYPKLTWFIILGVLMTLALVDLLFTRKIRYKVIHILVILIGISVHLKMAYSDAAALGRSKDYMPDQPIKFSHQVHAGANKIDCKYCHFNVEQGKQAGIPGPGLCMNCHLIVREGSRSGKSEIAKVVKHFEEGKDIEWVRIHNLPDHVFFSHAQHVKAGQLDCKECHGKVEEMHILKQENDLSMGWCINCHRKTNVQFTQNNYYSLYEDYHKELAQGVRDSIKAVDIGANDCMKCHY